MTVNADIPEAGLEIVFCGDRKCTIQQCQSIAKDAGYDKLLFRLHGPLKAIECQWLDAYFGMFRRLGEGSFMSMKDFEFADVWCTGLSLPAAPSAPPLAEGITNGGDGAASVEVR